MDAIKIDKSTGGISKIYFNGNSLNGLVFNGHLIWPASIVPNINIFIDDTTELNYETFDDLLD